MMGNRAGDLNRGDAAHERFQIEGMNRAHAVTLNGPVFFLALLHRCLSSYIVISSSKGFIPKQAAGLNERVVGGPVTIEIPSLKFLEQFRADCGAHKAQPRHHMQPLTR